MQLELVDNWHVRWGEVLDAIDYVGQRNALSIDPDGWLSARQNLIVAFDADSSIAGHVCFRVEPGTEAGQRVVDGRLEAMGVQPGFNRDEVESLLMQAADERARSLRCRRLIG